MVGLQAVLARIDRRYGFDRWGPDTNPLIRLAKRRAGRFSLRALLWITFGSGLLITTLMTLYILTSSREEEVAQVETLLAITVWGSYLITPLMVTILAVITTRRTVSRKQFELTILTPLSNEAIVGALIYTAMYRLRYVLLGLVLLFPLMVFPIFHWLLIDGTSVRHFTLGVRVYYPPDYWDVVGPTLGATAVAVGLWGLNLLGIAIGVGMALLRKYPSVAMISAPLSMLAIMLSPCCFTCWLGYTVQRVTVDCALCYLVVLVGVIMIAPYRLLHLSIYFTADRWRR